DVPASFLIDDKTSSGFIVLQVHSFGKDANEGTQIHWRDINILPHSLQKYTTKTPYTVDGPKNPFIISEHQEAWKLTQVGTSTKGWRGAKLESFPEQGWVIENGELTVLESEGKESAAGGDIVTVETYGDFELKVDFKITKGANSGIKYYVDTDLNKGTGSA